MIPSREVVKEAIDEWMRWRKKQGDRGAEQIDLAWNTLLTIADLYADGKLCETSQEKVYRKALEGIITMNEEGDNNILSDGMAEVARTALNGSEKEKKCDLCNGNGYTSYDDEGDHRCDSCGGTGKQS